MDSQITRGRSPNHEENDAHRGALPNPRGTEAALTPPSPTVRTFSVLDVAMAIALVDAAQRESDRKRWGRA